MFTLDGMAFISDLNGNKNIPAEINKYQDKINIAVRNAIESATIEIIERLKINMALYGISSLQNKIYASYGDDYVRIEVISQDEKGNNIAEYIEFGTGIRGSENPHPEPKLGWVYDSKGHKEEGWKYISDKDGKLHWTAGSGAKPFLYTTALWVKKRGVMARHVNGALRKLFK